MPGFQRRTRQCRFGSAHSAGAGDFRSPFALFSTVTLDRGGIIGPRLLRLGVRLGGDPDIEANVGGPDFPLIAVPAQDDS